MIEDPSKEELYNSPLHQLELQMYSVQGDRSQGSSDDPSAHDSSVFSSRESDRSSIYSFDSVSTNGRLLDRLGLDDEDLFDNGEEARVALRDSIISVQASKPMDKGLQDELKDSREVNSRVNPRERPIAPAINMHRYPSTSKGLLAQSESGREHKMSIKTVPKSIMLQDNNHSIDSLQAEIVSRSNSITSINEVIPKNPRTPLRREESTRSPFISRRPSSNNAHPVVPLDNNEHFTGSRIESPARNRSISLNIKKPPSFNDVSPRRVNSDNTHPFTYGLDSGSTPEERIKSASSLRNAGKHREASYQLQIAANPPDNHPKAMFLYAMALRFGKGVKQNDRSSSKWLCQSLLTHANPDNHKLIDRFKRMEPEEMLSLILTLLDKGPPVDPIVLQETYSKLVNTHGPKYLQHLKASKEHVGSAYHELGNAVMNGWGFKSRNELLGIRLISKAASLGNVTSMTQLGEIWCLKTKYHKKDHHKAAAWLRLSEVFGAETIGNSWIYKEKYMSTKK